MTITPQQRAQWRRDAESDLRSMITAAGARECHRELALLDALDAAEHRIDAVLALCERWDSLTHGETGTTRQIRAALRGEQDHGGTGVHSDPQRASGGDSGGLTGHSGASDSNDSEGDPA